MVSHETFISYRRFRWLWITIAALFVAIAIYVVDSPPGGRNGGTVVGYTYGVLAAIAIVWLMAYGLRKRSYSSHLGTVEGWLAAHVWIGIGLLLFVPLHSGFSFGINVHNLAYWAMAVTIVSGIWGAANYATLSAKITAHRGGTKDVAIVEQIHTLTRDIEKLCVGKGEKFLAILNTFDFSLNPGFWSLFRLAPIPIVDHVVAGSMVAELAEADRDDAVTLLGLLDRKSDLSRALLEQTRIKALLKVWLFVHVPASVVLCVALVIHIASVFFFW